MNTLKKFSILFITLFSFIKSEEVAVKIFSSDLKEFKGKTYVTKSSPLDKENKNKIELLKITFMEKFLEDDNTTSLDNKIVVDFSQTDEVEKTIDKLMMFKVEVIVAFTEKDAGVDAVKVKALLGKGKDDKDLDLKPISDFYKDAPKKQETEMKLEIKLKTTPKVEKNGDQSINKVKDTQVLSATWSVVTENTEFENKDVLVRDVKDSFEVTEGNTESIEIKLKVKKELKFFMAADNVTEVQNEKVIEALGGSSSTGLAWYWWVVIIVAAVVVIGAIVAMFVCTG